MLLEYCQHEVMQHVLKSCIVQDGEPKVNSIFEKARAMGATEGSIADLQQPGSSGIVLICHTVRLQQSCGVLASKNCLDTHWMFCYTTSLSDSGLYGSQPHLTYQLRSCLTIDGAIAEYCAAKRM